MDAVHPGGVGVNVGLEVVGTWAGELGEVAARDVRGGAGAGGEDAPIEGGYEDLRAEAVGLDDFGDGCYLLLWWGAELGCFWGGLVLDFCCGIPFLSIISFPFIISFPLASLPSTTRRSRPPRRVQLGAPSATQRSRVRFDFDVDEEVGVVLRPVAKFFEGGDGDLVELGLVGKALLVVAARAQGADVVAF